LTQEFEKDLRKSVDIRFINVQVALTKTRINDKQMRAFLSRIRQELTTRKRVRVFRSPRRQTFRNRFSFRKFRVSYDILITAIISLKYHCVSFLADSMCIQIFRRKKHWPYVYKMKRLLSRTLPSLYFKRGLGEIHTIRVSVNGKINGRNRSINYLFFKKVKDKQKPRVHQNYLYINYGFREVISKYGVFAFKI